VNFAGNAPVQYACWFGALVFVKKWYKFIEPLCRCVSFVSYHQSCQNNLQNQYSFTDTHDGCYILKTGSISVYQYYLAL
jgi:hypothetical protein